MFELTINSKTYQFNFGMGFLKKIDPTVTKPIDGIKGKVQNMGLHFAVAGIIDGDFETLVDVLYRANEGFTPRIEKSEIEAHIENPETDIDGLFEKVLDFLYASDCGGKIDYKTCKEIYDLIKDVDFENKGFK